VSGNDNFLPVCFGGVKFMSETELLPRVTDENYKDFIQSPGALILFKIASCQQCEEFEPIVEKTAKEFGEKIRFGKSLLHVPGACREIKREHFFESFPTTHFYKNGSLVYSFEGKITQEEFKEQLSKHLL
jgi:thioredoxin-like negative regulator of GroEL